LRHRHLGVVAITSVLCATGTPTANAATTTANVAAVNTTAMTTATATAMATATVTAMATVERPWKDDVMAFVVTDRFFDGDAANNTPDGCDSALYDPQQRDIAQYHGGDFRGLERAIIDGYFTDLGITAIWLTPPVRNAWLSAYDIPGAKTGYHGYWAQDFLDIDPHLTSAVNLAGEPYPPGGGPACGIAWTVVAIGPAADRTYARAFTHRGGAAGRVESLADIEPGLRRGVQDAGEHPGAAGP